MLESEEGGHLGVLGPFVNLATFEDSVELEATVLIDGREGVKVQVSIPGSVGWFENTDRWRYRELRF